MNAETNLAELAGIPQAARPLWHQLVGAPLAPVHELFAEVHAYQTTLARRATRQGDDVDPTLAAALAQAALRLLGTLGEHTPEPTRRAVQAAVRYFVIEDDADGDLDSILGLDDDAEVMNAVLQHLGHDSWIVNVP